MIVSSPDRLEASPLNTSDTPPDGGSAAGPALAATVLAASGLTPLANATIAPALPGLSRAFADTPRIETLAGLVMTLPSLAVVLTAALAGRLVERVDRRRVLVGALLLYALGGASGALADTMTGILVGRLVLGVGLAGTLTVATLLAAELWTGPARARFMGRQSASMAACGVVFLLAGGALAGLHWRGPFLIYLLALPLMIAVLALVPPARPGSAARADDDAAPFPWLAAVGISGLMFLAMACFFLAPTRLPFLLEDIGVRSPPIVALALAAMPVASFPAGLLYGRVRARLQPPAIAAIGFAAIGAGFLIVSQAHSLIPIVGGTLATGFGIGLIFPNQTLWLMARVPEGARGRAAGLLTAMLFGGQFASPLLSGALAHRLSPHDVFLAFALAILGIVAALALRHRRHAS